MRRRAAALRGGERPATALEVLTPREREIFDLLVKGDSVKEIAFKLDLSHKTVHVHRANVWASCSATAPSSWCISPSIISCWRGIDVAPLPAPVISLFILLAGAAAG